MVGVFSRPSDGRLVQALPERQAVQDREVLFDARGVGGQALVSDPCLARDDDRNAKTRELHPRLGPIDDGAVAPLHQRVSAEGAFGADHEHVCRDLAKHPMDFVDRTLSRLGHPASEFARVDTYEQLDVAATGEILDGAPHPIQHVRERIGRIMELSIPDDIREHADDRLVQVEAGLRCKSRDIFVVVPVEPDPVARSIPSAVKIGHDLLVRLG